jgi:hypothetical protein
MAIAGLLRPRALPTVERLAVFHHHRRQLPGDAVRGIGFVADTVADANLSGAKDETAATASRAEGRILVTLDLDFANIRAYPRESTPGLSSCGSNARIRPLCSRMFAGWRRR